MKGKVVAILETRTGEHLAELMVRRGATALWAPALEEVPDVDPAEVRALLARWKSAPYHHVIFQTGVGTRALFQATDALDLTADLLELLVSTHVIVRGPKPVGELNSRRVRIDMRAASPFTTETVLGALIDTPLQNRRVLVQRYGAHNARLLDALQGRGAAVDEIVTYRWSLPADVEPLQHLLGELEASRIDAVVFTSAVQVHNLYAVARSLGVADTLAGRLNLVLVASIGPVCSRVLREYGIAPSIEADPPKLGPLVAALDLALGAD